MIKLSRRLSAIASMVDGNILADIGCDHALLDIYLIQNKKIKKSIACDITEGALNQAKKNIKLNNINNIETRLADGLEKVTIEDKIDTIVLSGLGDAKIINILTKGKEKINNVKNIIIQANTGVDKIRKFMISINYYIEDEILIKENNIIYTIIKFVKGIKKYSKKEILFGPIILKDKDILFKELIENIVKKNNKIIKSLPNSKLIKKIKIYIINNYYKRMLK